MKQYESAWEPSLPLTDNPELVEELYERSREHIGKYGVGEDWLILGYPDRIAMERDRHGEAYLDVPESAYLQELD